MSRFLHTLVATLLLLCPLSMTAQVEVVQRIDSLQILIGQQDNLVLQVKLPKGQSAVMPSFKPSQQLAPGIEVVEWTDKDTVSLGDDRIQLTRVYTLTSFDENVYNVPALDVKVGGKSYHGNPVPLKVLTVDVDTVHKEKFYPPKGIQDNPFLWSEWLSPFLLSLLAVAFCIAIVYMYMRLKQNKPILTRIHIVKRIPPHQKALDEINVIKQQHVTTQESQKAYYTQLTDTLRQYIKSRFGFNATEMTSSEIIARLHESGDEKMLTELRELFMTADLVKFAKYETYINENDMNLVNAMKFIDETKSDEVVHEERVVSPLNEGDRKSNRQRLYIKLAIGFSAFIAAALLAYAVYSVVMLLI